MNEINFIFEIEEAEKTTGKTMMNTRREIVRQAIEIDRLNNTLREIRNYLNMVEDFERNEKVNIVNIKILRDIVRWES